MKIGIIGNGIVGATVGYLLAKELGSGNDSIIIFDEETGQATKASAGIIAPWLSKRRNKKWYALAKEGANFFAELANETAMPLETYNRSGVVYTRTTIEATNQLAELAQERIISAPQMGKIKVLSHEQLTKLFPYSGLKGSGVLITGGARVDGQQVVNHLNTQSAKLGVSFKKTRATISRHADKIVINDESFDKVIITAGFGTANLLEELGYRSDLRAQKGQLIEVNYPDHNLSKLPVLMPEGERDFIPMQTGNLIIGATHENDQGTDLTIDSIIKSDLLASGQKIIPSLTEKDIVATRVGTRAYTSDFAPFFGQLPNDSDIQVTSGLGSSGLTTGPLIAKLLVKQLMGHKPALAAYTKDVSEYVKKR